MTELQKIYLRAKRSRKATLRSAVGRRKRHCIFRLRANKAYKIKDQDAAILPVWFGQTKLSFRIIACAKEIIKRNNPFGMYRMNNVSHMPYSMASKLTLIPTKELPLYIGLEHDNLLEELLREA